MYRLGERWDSQIYRDGERLLKEYILQAQSIVSEEEFGGDVIREYLDSVHPQIGDRVSNPELKSYLKENTEYYGTELDKIMSKFNRHSAGYGWRPISPRKVNGVSVRMYERVRVPLGGIE